MRVLFATLAEIGHVGPFVGVALLLAQRGHDVGWYMLPGVTRPPVWLDDLIAASGASVLTPPVYPRSEIDERNYGCLTPDTLRTDRRALIRGAMLATIEHVQASSGSECIDVHRVVHDRFEPDVAVIDPLLWEAGIALELDDTPYVGVATNLACLLPLELIEAIDAWGFDRDVLTRWRQARDRFFASFGLTPEFSVFNPLSPWVNTTFTTREFVADHARLVPTMHLVGPSVIPERDAVATAAFCWERLDPRRKLVIASFGSQVYWQPARLMAIAEAARDLPVQLVIGCGALADTDFAETLPGDPIVSSWIPQRRLLDRAAALITHGGANSVMEAHVAGVPMLVSPVDIDQPVQAYFVDRSGGGVWLDLAADGAARACRDALLELIDDDSRYRCRADEIAASYRAHDGAEHTAALALELGAR